MSRISAGLLMYRLRERVPEVLLVHPGGPFWKNKDKGAWSIPKGEPEPDEELLNCAQREFEEELGFKPHGQHRRLDPVRQRGGKIVHAWTFEGDCNTSAVHSNTYRIQWPPRSGRYREVPEVDRAEFFDLKTARSKINVAQIAFLDQLEQQIVEDRS